MQLFVARTTATNSGFLPDETNLNDVATICQRLDGIPLAIEFAAARAAMLGVSGVASHLDNRFSLLTAGRRTTLARHQTLRAALDWSYDLLTASEQCLLRHLSIFPAGFTLEAAAAVARDIGHETIIIEGIADLVGKSLVALDGSALGGRWRLLETIRAYALEKLQDSGEAERALRRHAEFFRDLLTPTGRVSTLEPASEAVIRYNREIDNVRAALDWCFSPNGDVSIGIALTAAFLPMWLHSALIAECRRRTEIALAHFGDAPNGDARLRMLLHIGRGITLNHTGGRREEAAKVLMEGLRIAEALGDANSQMYALWGLWVTHGYKGKYRATEPVAEQFSRLAAAAADPARGYLADRLMGTTMFYRGNQLKARAHLDRVADQYRRSLEQSRAAWFGYDLSDFAQSTLARVLCLQGFLDQARNLAQSCIDRVQSASQKVGLCYALVEAACPVAFMVNDMDAATKHVMLFTEAATALDLIYWKTMARCWEGVLLVRQGNYESGVSALRVSLAACDEAGGTSLYAGFLRVIAQGLAGLGQMDEASLTLDQALARAESDGEEWCVPSLLCAKGELALCEPGPATVLAAAAEKCFRDAIELARTQGALLWELRGASHLARLRLEQKHPEDARQILASVYGRFVEGFETPNLRAAKTLLDSLPAGQPL